MAGAEGHDRLRAILDESFCLALIRTRTDALLKVFDEYEPGALGVAATTVAVLLERARLSREPERNRRALEQFLLPLEIVALGAKAAVALASLDAIAVGGAANVSSEARMAAAVALASEVELITCAPLQYASVPHLRFRALHVAPRLPESPAIGLATRGLVLAVGSHDLTLDLLGERVHALSPTTQFCTAHVGSLEGLHAVRRGEAHLAGTHLLDEETGDYNGAVVRRLLEEHGPRSLLVGFVRRMQGMIVGAGNPKAIEAVDDLAREDVSLVNRQPGAGTRVLLDYSLRRHRLSPAHIRGYDNERLSHTAVAAAIAAGDADCGFGIQAAAQVHGLGFVPLVEERYDLLIPVEHYESALLAPLRVLLERTDPELTRAIHALGGYVTEGMGRVLAEY